MSGGDRTTPSETVTRKPDSDVGSGGQPPAGGGRQTAEQTAITSQGSGQESGGRSDSERKADWPGGAADSNPGVGGSSQGQSDRKAADGPQQGKTVIAGHSKPEHNERSGEDDAMSDDRKRDDEDADEPRNQAPDAVKDPNEKTDGKPGAPAPQDGDEDPGAG